MGSDGLAVDIETAGDLRDRKPLAVKIQNHDEFPKRDHRVLPPAYGRIIGNLPRRLPPLCAKGRQATRNWGIFNCHKWGELRRHSQRHERDPRSKP